MTGFFPPFFNLVTFDRLGSTSDEAKRRARAGAVEGTLVTAQTQTAGRGRQGRVWVSPPGNLYVSLVLRPEGPPAEAAQLGFAACLAVGDAILRFLPRADLAFKWPNDVLLAGRKTAGILLESEAEGGALRFLVLGIGVNLASYPEETAYPATSLVAAGAEVAPEAFLEALAPAFLVWYERWRQAGFAPLRRKWLERAFGLGQALLANLPGERVDGRFAGLDEEGRLLLDHPAGMRRIAAAEVFPTDAA
jgi:BirA family transcriptional regulator, biotin operon repressor / biotin---[acetyl-CoA-carboxylase] ligase